MPKDDHRGRPPEARAETEQPSADASPTARDPTAVAPPPAPPIVPGPIGPFIPPYRGPGRMINVAPPAQWITGRNRGPVR